MYVLAIGVAGLWPQMTCGAKYTLCMMYSTCGLGIRTNHVACEEM